MSATRFTGDNNGNISDGNIIEGKVVSSRVVEDSEPTPQAGRGTDPAGNGLHELLAALRASRGAIVKQQPSTSQQVAQAFRESQRIRKAQEKWGIPATADIVVRREGVTRRENPRDRALFDAQKANRELPRLLFEALVGLAKLTGSGKKLIMEDIAHLIQMDGEYPPELAPFGELLSEWAIGYLMGVYQECLEMEGDLSLEEIARAWVSNRRQAQY